MRNSCDCEIDDDGVVVGRLREIHEYAPAIVVEVSTFCVKDALRKGLNSPVTNLKGFVTRSSSSDILLILNSV